MARTPTVRALDAAGSPPHKKASRRATGRHQYTRLPTGGAANEFPPNVVVSEVADLGSSGMCGGESWVELANLGNADADISGWKLYNSAGISSPFAYIFPAGSTTLPVGGFVVLCYRTGYSFVVGGSDAVSLADATGFEVSTSGALASLGVKNYVWARKPYGTYTYTTIATPGSANVVSYTGAQPDPYAGAHDHAASDVGADDRSAQRSAGYVQRDVHLRVLNAFRTIRSRLGRTGEHNLWPRPGVQEHSERASERHRVVSVEGVWLV